MQAAKLSGTPLGPIALHALVHAVLVGIAVAAIVRPVPMLLLAAVAVEFWTHLGIDWYRGRLSARYPVLRDPGERLYWTVLGLDQLAHGLVLLVIAVVVLL
jgi:nitrogen fixation/metabolism regulation signal transduction histidine kinase